MLVFTGIRVCTGIAVADPLYALRDMCDTHNTLTKITREDVNDTRRYPYTRKSSMFGCAALNKTADFFFVFEIR